MYTDIRLATQLVIEIQPLLPNYRTAVLGNLPLSVIAQRAAQFGWAAEHEAYGAMACSSPDSTSNADTSCCAGDEGTATLVDTTGVTAGKMPLKAWKSAYCRPCSD